MEENEKYVMTFKDRVLQVLAGLFLVCFIAVAVITVSVKYKEYKIKYASMDEEVILEIEQLYVVEKGFSACVDGSCYRANGIILSDATYIKLKRRKQLNVAQFMFYAFTTQEELYTVEIHIKLE